MDDDTDDKPLISYLAKSSGLHLRSKVLVHLSYNSKSLITTPDC